METVFEVGKRYELNVSETKYVLLKIVADDIIRFSYGISVFGRRYEFENNHGDVIICSHDHATTLFKEEKQ